MAGSVELGWVRHDEILRNHERILQDSQESYRLHEQRMAHVDERLVEIAEKLHALIQFVDDPSAARTVNMGVLILVRHYLPGRHKSAERRKTFDSANFRKLSLRAPVFPCARQDEGA